ncbi:MAG: long-chain fatty acid--CoA ligase [Candidatus Aminicenantes bacterium]|nr:long-chain fatty acid--CoA ligase [Candidatus Aminicenantes bacterium]
MQTLAELFLNTVRSFPKPDFLKVKRNDVYTDISMAGFEAAVREFALGLKDLGHTRGAKLIILSENRPEWTMTDFANLCLGGVSVPIYTTLVAEQVKYIINDSDAEIVVVSNLFQFQKIASIRADLPKVKHIIIFQPKAPAPGVLTMEGVRERGRALAAAQPRLFEDTARSIRPEDDASIIYTSGTTGLPKGVVLTHGNFISNIVSVSNVIHFSATDTVLSFLPLSHVLERMVTFTYVYKGCSIGYAENAETVAHNLLEIRPQIMVSVPRVFEKIYSRVMDNVMAGSGLKRRIFFWGVKIGKAAGQKKLAGKQPGPWLAFRQKIAAKLVYSKVIEKTGGRVRFFVSGGAPLSKDIAEFFYALGLTVLEGYGLTETSPVLAVNTFEALRFGTVGRVLPGVEIKIAPDGEILAKGPNIMKGYYKKPAETEDVFENGWFKTGDIGFIDADGFLTITDRKKDLIVTAGGKNIAPQPIENVLKTNPYISNAVVLGDRRRYVGALIVPNFEKLEEYARFVKIPFKDRAELVRNEQIESFLRSEIERSTPNLASYERIKKIAILDHEFDIDRDEITPTLKVKRNIIENRYQDLIEGMYKGDLG